MLLVLPREAYLLHRSSCTFNLSKSSLRKRVNGCWEVCRKHLPLHSSVKKDGIKHQENLRESETENARSDKPILPNWCRKFICKSSFWYWEISAKFPTIDNFHGVLKCHPMKLWKDFVSTWNRELSGFARAMSCAAYSLRYTPVGDSRKLRLSWAFHTWRTPLKNMTQFQLKSFK